MNSALPADTDVIRRCMDSYDVQELRKELYEVADEKRENGETRLAIKLVLTGWNWRAYAGTDITNTELDEQIESLIERTELLTDYIKKHDHTLGSLDFDARVGGATVKDHIVEAYTYLTEQPAIEATGASKALHMLSPSIFMMWDTAIIERYHQQGESAHWPEQNVRGLHKRGSAHCYLAFLEETQSFVRSSLDMTAFSRQNPVKVLDEYNYASYTF